ncbi:unnamed protein product, partial [Rotaria sp. Silwood1]
MLKMALSIVIFVIVSILIDGTHYRGGFITWKPQYPHIINQNPVAIILKQRHVWRRSSIFCNDTTITTKGLIGNGSVNCISTCSTTGVLASVSAPCVAYSIKNDWSVGEVSTVINVSANVKFEAAFQGGSWISTLGVGADGGWSISAEITTIPRSDAPFYCGQPQAGSCISVNTGSKINKIAQFSIGCATTTVIEVDIYKPDGMMVGPLKVNPSNSSLYTISITWTPTSMDIGTNLLCYTPLDDRNQQGDQVCIKYFVSDNDSKFARFKYINGSLKPVGQVYSNQSVWYIEYTNEVRRPSLDAYVRFYSNSTNKQVHQINVRTNLKDVIFSKNTLTFFTSINWILGEHYYILLDRSVVTDPSVCGPQSPPVDDVNFWTFEVQSE